MQSSQFEKEKVTFCCTIDEPNSSSSALVIWRHSKAERDARIDQSNTSTFAQAQQQPSTALLEGCIATFGIWCSRHSRQHCPTALPKCDGRTWRCWWLCEKSIITPERRFVQRGARLRRVRDGGQSSPRKK